MNSYKIHTIDLNFLNQSKGIACFLIETDQGPSLIETGPHSTLPHLEAGLKNLSYKLSDIKHVFITHIHLDHAGAAWCFADHGANIYLHPFGFNHMNDPSRLLASAKMIYKEMMDSLWGTLKPIQAAQLHIVEDFQKISVLGLEFTAHHTPGHAKHHIAWQLVNNLFTGDVAGVCIQNGPIVPPCPPPDIQIEDWLSSIKRMEELTEVNTFYLTHFGEIKDIKNHLNKLTTALEEYSRFFESYARNETALKEVIPPFTKFARDYLLRNGLDEKYAAAYEAANPSDMSAAGLMRYWTKKLNASN